MRAAVSALVALLGAAACQRPATVAECAALSDPGEREECRFQLTLPAIDDLGGPKERINGAALAEALAAIDDAQSRDLLLLRLAITAPAQGPFLCTRVSTDGAREKCRQVIGRPHLGTSRKPPQPPAEGR